MDKRQEERIKVLGDMGLVFNGQEYICPLEGYGDINYHWTDLACDTDEQFSRAVKGIRARLGLGKIG